MGRTHVYTRLDFGLGKCHHEINRVDIPIIDPQEGIPILYHDQMNVIAKHVAEIKDNLEEHGARHQQ